MSIIASVTTPLTDEQERTRHFAYRVAALAAGVLYDDETAWSTSPDPIRHSDGFRVRRGADGATEAFWQITYVRRPGEHINRAEVQAFDADRYGRSGADEISAKVSVGRYPYAGETYLSSALSDESIRQIIRAMDTVFWMNRNHTAQDRKATATGAPRRPRNTASASPSGPEPADGHTGNPNTTTGPETDARRAAIAAEITETIRNFEFGDLDDEDLDERLATISGLITSWGSCPDDVAKQDSDLRWHHDRRNLTDWEITTRLRVLLGLVEQSAAGPAHD